ncbi:MAG TPA: phenylalanine--tRNA ligase subunit beta [Ignavibacteria bacterium]|nr:phenylalanine--tRNA ligase subunit beta [Ignavibacteria bacterium]
MKISLNWLKEYIPGFEINTDEDLKLLTDKMISCGLDIEKTENEGEIYKNFIVGEVTEKQKHPNADKLSLCKVDIGGKILSIVCGASNVEAGQKVCVATIGAIIPNGSFEIKKSKIRGELSEGMICSEKELNMEETIDGILVLDKNTKTGINFADHIKANDIIFEIGITPNRGDLFSHIGVAREIAALYDLKIQIPEISLKETEIKTEDLINISIEDNELCKRFTGRVIKNVEIKESPEWLQKRLLAVGLRPRNNIVDITNFVMFETGQPLHAFDYDKIRGKKIIVKNANNGDKFITLDSKERELNSASLMVCDGEGYSGIAGIMGGEFSEITNSTKNIFLESAYFDPVSVRKNSKKLGLQTDASQRFERGIDIEMVKYASLRAAQLINEIAGGEVSSGFYDVYTNKFEKHIVGLRRVKASKLIGLELTEENIVEILDKIEIKFNGKENEYMMFEIPEFRRLDIQREADLIEEVTRIYGYENIEEDSNFTFNASNSSKYSNSNKKPLNLITNHLTGRGFNEIISEPLADENKLKLFPGKPAILLNSISAGLNALRTNLSYGMLNAVRNNFNNSGKDISLKLYETGKIFTDEDDKFHEESRLIMALSGKKDVELIYGGEKYFDIFDLKGEVEMLLSKLNLENYRLFYYNDKDSGEVKIDIRLNEEVIGNINKADSFLKKEFDIESDVFIAELNLDKIYKKLNFTRYYKPVSKFPSVKRDIAIVVEKNVSYDEIKENVKKSGGNLLKNIELFDIYEGDKISGDRKSIAFSLEFLSEEKTLTDEETNKLTGKIISNLEKNLSAELRK